MSSSRVIAIIPARAGSKRVPNKNRRLLYGKPLIDWTVQAAQLVEDIDNVVITTDDSEILKAYHPQTNDNETKTDDALNSITLIERPAELADDRATTTSVIKHAIDSLALTGSDTLVLLQPTSPFRNYEDVTQALKLFNEGKSSSLISVTCLDYDPEWCLTLNESGVLSIPGALLTPKRTQDIEKRFIPNGAIYIKRVSEFLSDNGFYGSDCAPYVMSKLRSLDIDTEDDFLIAEALAAKFLS